MKPPILIVASGALSPAARSSYGRFEQELREAFPDREIAWAFTAGSLVARLRARGEQARLPAEAYAELGARGFRELLVLSLHLVPGEQYQSLLAADPQGLRVGCTGPLLGTDADIETVARAMAEELPRDRPVLVVAHGHAREAQGNAALLALGERLGALHPDLLLTRLEGEGAPGDLEAFIERARLAGKAHVEPFLFVAGAHLNRDILGSLKARLGLPELSVGGVLGERPWLRRLLIERLAGS